MDGHIPKTILIVEDDPVTAVLTSQTVRDFGYAIITADSGNDAVDAALGKNEIDLILMDIDLGSGIDGTEAAKLILAKKNVPIVFLTSHAERDMVEKVRGITRYGYIIKNSGSFVLRSSIEMAFELFDAHRDIEAKMVALRESEEIFSQFMKHSPIYVFFKDDQIRSLRLSANYEKMLDRPLKELLGRNMNDLFPSDLAKKMVDDDTQILKEGKVKYIDEEFNGRKYTTIKYPIHINDKPTYLAGFTIDITDQTRIEDALREGEAKLSAIFQNSNDAIGVSRAGIHTLVNPAYAALFGYQNADELNGMPVLDIIAHEDRDAVWQKIQKRANNEPAPLSYETLGLRKDGTTFDMEVNASTYLLREELFTVVVMRDITKRKRAEEALQKSEAQKNAILNGITTNIAFVDSGLNIIWVNRAAAISVNKTPDEMTGRSCHEFWADPSKPCEDCPTLKAFKTKKTEQTIIHTPDGRTWEERGEPVFDTNGDLIGVVEIASDITDRVRAEEKIKMLLVEKEFMLKEVHHRIKNNMNSVMGLLSLQSNMIKEPAAISALNDARSRILSMMVLYDKLYCSADFNEISIKDYLEPLVDEIVNMFSSKTAVKVNKNIDDFKLCSKSLSPLGIIMNELITNIMKYAFNGSDNPEIKISASIKNSLVTCVVEDNGKGLPESINIESSAGFGLQLVDMLVKQIRGNIVIERAGGTRFILEFKA